MDQHESFSPPKKIRKGLPQPISTEILQERNADEWSRIELVHKNVNEDDGDNETNLDECALQIALEAEIELLAHAPIPSVKEEILKGITMHKSLVSKELSSDVADLKRTEAFLDKQILNIDENINERKRFLQEQRQIFERLKEKQQNLKLSSDTKKNNISGGVLKQVESENDWLHDAIRSFSDIISEFHETRTSKSSPSPGRSDFPYLERASLLINENDNHLNKMIGPADMNRKRHLLDETYHPRSDECINNNNNKVGRDKILSQSFYSIATSLITRWINNPDDPYIVLSPENKESYVVDLLIKCGVAERHPRDSSLLKLLRLTR